MELLKTSNVSYMREEKLEETLNLLTPETFYQTENLSENHMMNEILEINFDETGKKVHLSMTNKLFLEQCEQFIIEHSRPESKSLQKKPVNFSTEKNEEKKVEECIKCKENQKRYLEWMGEKRNLENVIRELEEKLSLYELEENLKEKELKVEVLPYLHIDRKLRENIFTKVSEVVNITIYDSLVENYLTKSRAYSEETMSTIQSEISPSELATEKEIFFESLKSYHEKLETTEAENKYLKIENHFLMKTKNDIENVKREMQKTKSERDMFKKKLISLTDKQQKQQNFSNAKNMRENNEHCKLKQRKIEQNQDELFELSLTDSQSIGQQHSNYNKAKKAERPHFITQKEQQN